MEESSSKLNELLGKITRSREKGNGTLVKVKVKTSNERVEGNPKIVTWKNNSLKSSTTHHSSREEDEFGLVRLFSL
jgi:hypothetical protein